MASDVISFQNDRSVRSRATGSMAAFALLLLVIAIGQRDFIAVVFPAAAAFVAYRNWVAGLFLSAHTVTVRNVFATRRIDASEVTDVDFSLGRALTGWGYVRLIRRNGRNLRVTALRRDAFAGESLAAEIRRALTPRSSESTVPR